MNPIFFMVTKSPSQATLGAAFSQYHALIRTFCPQAMSGG